VYGGGFLSNLLAIFITLSGSMFLARVGVGGGGGGGGGAYTAQERHASSHVMSSGSPHRHRHGHHQPPLSLPHPCSHISTPYMEARQQVAEQPPRPADTSLEDAMEACMEPLTPTSRQALDREAAVELEQRFPHFFEVYNYI
jgi:hypothetical protein